MFEWITDALTLYLFVASLFSLGFLAGAAWNAHFSKDAAADISRKSRRRRPSPEGESVKDGGGGGTVIPFPWKRVGEAEDPASL